MSDQAAMPRSEPVRVALLVTCLVDLFRPSVGFAAVALLEAAGCTVEVPRAQTCCGQPAYNSGDRADAKAVARQVIAAFAGYDYVVAPSGSCAGMLRVHYPGLFADDPAMLPQAQELAARTWELVAFLVDVRGMTSAAARWADGRRRSGRSAPPQGRHSATMEPASHSFPANVRVGLADPVLQRALGLGRPGFPLRRQQAIERLPEFEALREEGRQIKDHTLAHLDFYLELYEKNVAASGGRVHWARTAAEARAAVLEICRSVDAKIVTKGKSMVAEEIALNDHLEANGITPIETDLGAYIIQLRHEPPSHIIAPAIHLMKEQVADAFRAAHTELDPERALGGPRELA